jgi:ketosteroid isomerase-like protein
MKQLSIFFLTISFVGLLTISCVNKNYTSTDFDVTKMKKIIEEKNNEFTEAHITGKKDSAVMVNYFTQDAKIFPPNSEPVIGQLAISELTSQYMKFSITEFSEETTAFYGNEDYLIDEGNYFMSYGEDNTVEKGKYLNVWKKEDGEWKVYSNIWNTNMPATTAE